MTAEPGFHLHSLAAPDITDIWEFIAKHKPLAALRVREDISSAIRRLRFDDPDVATINSSLELTVGSSSKEKLTVTRAVTEARCYPLLSGSDSYNRLRQKEGTEVELTCLQL